MPKVCSSAPGSDARELQELRALQRAGREDHFAARRGRSAHTAADVLDRLGTSTFDDDARRACDSVHVEILPTAHGPQVSGRRAAPKAPAREQLVVADAFRIARIEVFGPLHAELPSAGDDRVDQFVPGADIRARKRAAGTMRCAGAA